MLQSLCEGFGDLHGVNLLPLSSGLKAATVSIGSTRSLAACAGGAADPYPRGETGPPSIRHANAVSAWCGRRDSNPHNFRHWNLNPARLPVPPRPREQHHIRPRCRGRRAYNMGSPVRSKKMAICATRGKASATGQTSYKMVRIGPMASQKTLLHRRELMAGLGAAALIPIWPATSSAQGRPSLALQAKAGSLTLRAGGPDTPIWALEGPDLRFKRGDTAEVAFGNELPLPSLLNWRGLDGATAIDPLTARAPLASGGKEALQVPLRHAGTFLCDLALLGDGQARPSRARALVVGESEASHGRSRRGAPGRRMAGSR